MTAAVIRTGLFRSRQDYPQLPGILTMYLRAPGSWHASGGRPTWPAERDKKETLK